MTRTIDRGAIKSQRMADLTVKISSLDYLGRVFASVNARRLIKAPKQAPELIDWCSGRGLNGAGRCPLFAID
jgi:hypothetical protein